MNIIQTSRPIRHIKASKLAYPNINIFVDDVHAVVRLLDFGYKSEVVSHQMLYTAKTLINKSIDLDGKVYTIIAEGMFNLDDPDDRLIWTPGNNVIAEYDPISIQQGIIRFYSKGPHTKFTKENSAEYNKRRGKSIPLQLFCRNKNDSLVDCSKSIVSQVGGLLLTNIDLTHSIEMVPDYVNQVKFASKFLNVQYKLTGPTTVHSNQVIQYQIEVFQEMKPLRCVEYTHDLHVYCDGGYLPVQLVSVVKGVGTFRLSTLGVQPNTTLKLKIGTRSYTNYDQLLINVI